jgi:diadenosine tetraphosphate (Ap4A) HIT family hydrolase
MTKKYERYFPDMDALHTKFRTAPCFVCEIVKGLTDSAQYIVYEDEKYIAFLDAFPRQLGYTLVSPKKHLEQISQDFSLDAYLDIHRLIYHIVETVRIETDAERMYVFTFGSNQGNSHVHWHVAPCPKGTPYDKQQGAAVGWQAGVLKIPHEDMVAIAKSLNQRLLKRLKHQSGTASEYE